MKFLKRSFNYIENFWIGADGKPSLRAGLAIAFSWDFINNLSFAIRKWTENRTLEGLSLVLGIEAGLIVALLGLSAYSNIAAKKIDSVTSSTTTETTENQQTKPIE